MCNQGLKAAEGRNTGPAGAPASREQEIKEVIKRASQLDDTDIEELICLARRLSSQKV